MERCPSPLVLAQWVDGCLSGESRRFVERHAALCGACRIAAARIDAPREAHLEHSDAALAEGVWAEVRRSLPRHPAPRRLSRPRHAWWGAAAALLLLAGGAWMSRREEARETVLVDAYGRLIRQATVLDAREVGEGPLLLPDGTTLHLAEDARVRIYPYASGGERGVDLLRGGIRLLVVPGSMPFRITGRPSMFGAPCEVRVLGTELEVRLLPLGRLPAETGLPVWGGIPELMLVDVFSGKAMLHNAQGRVLIRSRQRGIALAGEPPETAMLQ